MDSLRTLFRLVVMLAVLVIGYQGWKLYGPPAGQVKSLAVRILDAAKSAIDSAGASSEAGPGLSADPRPMAPPIGAPPLNAAASGGVIQAQALEPAGQVPASETLEPPGLAPPAAQEAASLATTPVAEASSDVQTAGEDARLLPLYSRLAELGAVEPRLAAWGSSGRLYRFACEASPAGAPGLHRQFEAIAAEPLSAVAEVVDKVAAWRMTQVESARLGDDQFR